MRLFTRRARLRLRARCPAALGRVQDADPRRPGGSRTSVAKDVWVRSGRADAPDRREGRIWLYEGPLVQPDRPESTSSPRVLEDMFWLGRYAERTEDLTRLLIVARERVDDFRFRPEHLGRRLRAGAARRRQRRVRDPRGRSRRRRPAAADPGADARRRRGRHASRSRSRGLRESAASVRDQLSARHLDGARRDRSRRRRARRHARATAAWCWPRPRPPCCPACSRCPGLAGENMVRDPGWYFMDLGRRLERAQQVTALLRSTLTRSHSSAVDSLVVESVLAASESGVTYRRRYRGRIQVATMLELLLLDAGNPRSLAYQVGAGQGRSAGAARFLRHLAAAAPAGGRGRRPCAAARPEELDDVDRRPAAGRSCATLLDGLLRGAPRHRRCHCGTALLASEPDAAGRRRHARGGAADDDQDVPDRAPDGVPLLATACPPRSAAGYLRPRELRGPAVHAARARRRPRRRATCRDGVDVYGNTNTYFHVTERAHRAVRGRGVRRGGRRPDLRRRGGGPAVGGGACRPDRRPAGAWSSRCRRRWSSCRTRSGATRPCRSPPAGRCSRRSPTCATASTRVPLRARRDVGVLDRDRRAGRRGRGLPGLRAPGRRRACGRWACPAATSPATWPPTRRPARSG